MSWSVDGQNMLRRADAAAIASGDPLALASFPLVPFSNRIGYARFVWQQRFIELAPNFAPEPHAIHGTGWKDVWVIAERSVKHCTLQLRHEGDNRWPWPFEASQDFSLNNGVLEMTLSATNLADEPVPLAFGCHPYFDQEGANLCFSATHFLMSGTDALPTKAEIPTGQFDFANGDALAGRDIDHCFVGWDGAARIEWEDRLLTLEIEANMESAVIYVSKGGSAFCFEPVPHISNALNRPGDLPDMPTVAPGESFDATVRLTAVKV